MPRDDTKVLRRLQHSWKESVFTLIRKNQYNLGFYCAGDAPWILKEMSHLVVIRIDMPT